MTSLLNAAIFNKNVPCLSIGTYFTGTSGPYIEYDCLFTITNSLWLLITIWAMKPPYLSPKKPNKTTTKKPFLHLSRQKHCTEHIDRWPWITLGCHMFPRSSHRSASCWTNSTSSFWDSGKKKRKKKPLLFAKCTKRAPDLVLRCGLSES